MPTADPPPTQLVPGRLSQRAGAALRVLLPGLGRGARLTLEDATDPAGDPRVMGEYTPPGGRPRRALERGLAEALEKLAEGDATRRFRVNPDDYRGWAHGIASGVRKAYRFRIGSAEDDDLRSTAVLELTQRAGLFNPAKHPGVPFKRWAKRYIKNECDREARRLRGGGTIKSPRATTQTPEVVPFADDGATDSRVRAAGRRRRDGPPPDRDDD